MMPNGIKRNVIGVIVSVAVPLFVILLLHAPENIGIERTIIAGTIRNAGDGWYVIDNINHRPINIKSVKEVRGVIYVEFPFRVKLVHTFMVTPDEVFASRGVSMGASCGLTNASITLHTKTVDGKTIFLDAGQVADKYANVWIYGVVSK